MSFKWPVAFLLLILIPVLVALYVWLQARRRRVIANYGSLGFLQQSSGKQAGLRRHVPPVFFLIGLTLLMVALTRPQAVISLPRVAGTVILGFDVSGSMAADDLKPTRMEAAKAAAQDFVMKQPVTVQVGVVAFSDAGFSVQAPSHDQEAILAAITRLSPQRGTSLAHGIQAALNSIASGTGETTHAYSNLTPLPTPTPTPVPKGTFTQAAIVLLSDGENNENPDPLAAAQAAADRGVRIYTIGIGSVAGSTVKIDGYSMHTQLDEQMLQQIAQITGGEYYNAQSEQDLRTIYDNLQSQLIIKPEQTELTAMFVGAGVLALLLGGVLSLFWFNRIP
ncbi:MAG TPA: VWA domain-containing protein [Anaerolineae bacterium]|jgi:Ca-activated chloride channel family protein